MSYESWRISFQSSEQAARAAYAEVEALRAEIEALREEVDALREVLARLITWTPSADTYRRLGFDPEAPMRVLEEARSALAQGQEEA